jgi:hypothetical protein
LANGPANPPLCGIAVTLLAQAGSAQELAAVTGYSLKSVDGIPQRLSRIHPLTDAAMKKFENASSTDFANRLQT